METGSADRRLAGVDGRASTTWRKRSGDTAHLLCRSTPGPLPRGRKRWRRALSVSTGLDTGGAQGFHGTPFAMLPAYCVMSRGSPWPMNMAAAEHGAARGDHVRLNAASRVCRLAKRPLPGTTVGAGLRFARADPCGAASDRPGRLAAALCSKHAPRGLATRRWPAGDPPTGGWRQAGAPQRAERDARDKRCVREDAGGSWRQDPPDANPSPRDPVIERIAEPRRHFLSTPRVSRPAAGSRVTRCVWS